MSQVSAINLFKNLKNYLPVFRGTFPVIKFIMFLQGIAYKEMAHRVFCGPRL